MPSESLIRCQNSGTQEFVRSFECAAHLAVLTDFLPKPDLPNRPHRNLFRSVSSFPPAFFFPFLNFFLIFLGHVSRNKNRQLISTVCSVLKLLLSHSGHHGLVVSYWFSERPITFPHNGCHYLFSISLQLGFHLSWFLPTAVDAFLAVAPRLTVKSVKASLSYCFKVFLFFLFLFFVVLFYLTMKQKSGDVDSFVSVVGQDKEPGVFFNAQARAWLR